jgi:methionine synthase I (cobalamin-dependent)
MKKSFQETLLERCLVCDGAMGTQLMLAGLAPTASWPSSSVTPPRARIA